jgi:hypothetical protein
MQSYKLQVGSVSPNRSRQDTANEAGGVICIGICFLFAPWNPRNGKKQNGRVARFFLAQLTKKGKNRRVASFFLSQFTKKGKNSPVATITLVQ